MITQHWKGAVTSPHVDDITQDWRRAVTSPHVDNITQDRSRARTSSMFMTSRILLTTTCNLKTQLCTRWIYFNTSKRCPHGFARIMRGSSVNQLVIYGSNHNFCHSKHCDNWPLTATCTSASCLHTSVAYYRQNHITDRIIFTLHSVTS